MKKILSIAIIVIYFLLLSVNIYKIAYTYTATINNHTKIIVSVFNQNGQPITNANVCIIEDKTYFTTDKNGFSEPITILSNDFDSKNRQSITILAYKAGFCSHIKYNVSIYKNQTRTGVVLFLYELYNETDKTIVTTYEEYPDTITNEIIQQYKRGG